MKAHAHFRTITGIQSGPDAFNKSTFVMTLLTILGVTEILCSFRLVLEGIMGKEMSQLSRLIFLERLLANRFALSDAEDNNCGPLNRGGIVDLPMLRTLLAIRLKSQELRFWEVTDSFVLVEYASLAASTTLLQLLHAYLNFQRNFLKIKRIYSVGKNKKSDFYELWQKLKQLKTMKKSKAWPDIYEEG